jgi:hypothetical protein
MRPVPFPSAGAIIGAITARHYLVSGRVFGRGHAASAAIMLAVSVPHRQIRADYDEESLIVYQAFSRGIAEEAVASGKFGPSFSRTRMTWIKPSFRWMLYRCGFATKPGQEHVLAIHEAQALLPGERPYPLPADIAAIIGATRDPSR